MIVFIHKCMKHLLNRHYCFRFWKVNKSISWSLKFYNNFYLKIKYFKFRLWQFCKILYLKTRLFLHDEKEYFCFCISKFFLEVWLPCNNLKNKTTNTIISIDQFLKFWFTFFSVCSIIEKTLSLKVNLDFMTSMSTIIFSHFICFQLSASMWFDNLNVKICFKLFPIKSIFILSLFLKFCFT